MPSAEALKAADTLIHVLWINAGLSCDGDSVALTAATQPSIEELALGPLPGRPPRRHPTQYRGDRVGRPARPAAGRRALAVDRLRVRAQRGRRRLPRMV